MSRELNKTERITAIGLCFTLLLIIVFRIVHVIRLFDIKDIYSNFFISEFMINYQGGFIRRGLLGELLYQMFIIHPYSLPAFILWFEIVVFMVFGCIVFYIFYRRKWLPIMPLAVNVATILDYRRDFLMLLFAFVVFYLLFQYIQKREKCFLFSSVLLSSLSILIYEPSFFFIVPISFLLFYNSLEKKKEALKSLMIFALPLLLMIIMCIAKGNTHTADMIWRSWQPLFDYQGLTLEKQGDAISFLKKPTPQVMMMHLNMNFGIGAGNGIEQSCQQILGSLLMFVGFYYLIVRIPSLKRQTKDNYVLLSDICLFQFVCLLPMFTILSCDFGRTINNVIYTTYFLVYFLEKYKVECSIPIIHGLSKSLCRSWNSRILSSVWFYLIVLLIVPFSMVGGVSVLDPLCQMYFSSISPKIQSLLSIIGL